MKTTTKKPAKTKRTPCGALSDREKKVVLHLRSVGNHAGTIKEIAKEVFGYVRSDDTDKASHVAKRESWARNQLRTLRADGLVKKIDRGEYQLTAKGEKLDLEAVVVAEKPAKAKRAKKPWAPKTDPDAYRVLPAKKAAKAKKPKVAKPPRVKEPLAKAGNPSGSGPSRVTYDRTADGASDEGQPMPDDGVPVIERDDGVAQAAE